MNGAKIVLKSLYQMGVDTIFGYPGGAVIPLYDELYKFGDKIKHYRSAHEQGAVHAADGYARTTEKVGVCVVTSGPGATNAITGIATAYMDSMPLLVISGQVPIRMLGKDSFQEIDITGITMSITKHNFLVRSISELEDTIKKAYTIAKSGRPGPVLIDIPKDIFMKDYPYKNLSVKKYQRQIQQREVNTINNSSISKAVQLLKSSKRPIIYAGGGVKTSKAEKELFEFSEKNKIPVVNTLMGLGSFERSNEKSLGLVGMHGFVEANLATMNADLIISIGARFSDRVIGNSKTFAQNAKVIHVDVDSTEIDKNIKSTIKIVGDAKEVLVALLKEIDEPLNTETWLQEIQSYKRQEAIGLNDYHPKNILQTVSENFDNDAIIATDVGQHQMWVAQYWPFSTENKFITSGGLGTMGFGLGAAIGSKVARANREVILVTGDGSFRMNANELIAISEYNLAVTIVLFNNRCLGMVRQWQKMFQEKRYSETTLKTSVDYCQLANSYGIESYQVENLKELNSVLRMRKRNKPLLIECKIHRDENVLPIVPPGQAINNSIV